MKVKKGDGPNLGGKAVQNATESTINVLYVVPALSAVNPASCCVIPVVFEKDPKDLVKEISGQVGYDIDKIQNSEIITKH